MTVARFTDDLVERLEGEGLFVTERQAPDGYHYVFKTLKVEVGEREVASSSVFDIIIRTDNRMLIRYLIASKAEVERFGECNIHKRLVKTCNDYIDGNVTLDDDGIWYLTRHTGTNPRDVDNAVDQFGSFKTASQSVREAFFKACCTAEPSDEIRSCRDLGKVADLFKSNFDALFSDFNNDLDDICALLNEIGFSDVRKGHSSEDQIDTRHKKRLEGEPDVAKGSCFFGGVRISISCEPLDNMMRVQWRGLRHKNNVLIDDATLIVINGITVRAEQMSFTNSDMVISALVSVDSKKSAAEGILALVETVAMLEPFFACKRAMVS